MGDGAALDCASVSSLLAVEVVVLAEVATVFVLCRLIGLV